MFEIELKMAETELERHKELMQRGYMIGNYERLANIHSRINLIRSLMAGEKPAYNYIGRCTKKGCRHTERITVYRLVDGYSEVEDKNAKNRMIGARCPEHLIRLDWHRINGEVNNSVPCDTRCTNARGHNCECSCGGKNHGTAHSI